MEITAWDEYLIAEHEMIERAIAAIWKTEGGELAGILTRTDLVKAHVWQAGGQS